jgi:hypothetical protein
MGAPEDRTDPRFTTLPDGVRLEDTVAVVDTNRTPGPDDVRNAEQHAALRDD